jgi:hypothetical protein
MRLFAIAMTAMACVLACQAPARAAFVFTPVATSPSGQGVSSLPTINNSGTSTFLFHPGSALPDIVNGKDMKSANVVYQHGVTPFVALGPGYSTLGPATNAHGLTAFVGQTSTGSTGVFTGTGGPATTVATTNNTPFFSFDSVDLNNHGTVAFGAHFFPNPSVLFNGIYVGSGGTVTTIAERGANFSFVGMYPTINDSGTVAFLAVTSGGAEGIYEGNGGTPTKIYDASTGPLQGITEEPVINNNGTLLFAGTSQGALQLFTGNGGALTSIVTLLGPNSGPFSGLIGANGFMPYSINNNDQVAFGAHLKGGGEGIFTGSDPVADKVIQTGDTLNGGIVTFLDFGARGLNDQGQVTFRALTRDASGVVTDGVYIATPPFSTVPEPSSFGLLAGSASLATLAWIRRRRGRRASE